MSGGGEEKGEVKPLHPAQVGSWEGYPTLKGYFGGLGSLVRKGESVAEWPAREGVEQQTPPQMGEVEKEGTQVFKLQETKAKDNGNKPVECSFGEGRRRPEVRAFNGVPNGFPDSLLGSHTALGIDDGICFERRGRYGDYGLGYSPDLGGIWEGVDGGDEAWSQEISSTQGGRIDWRGVDWKELQDQCYKVNEHRFNSTEVKGVEKPKRIAILLRTWIDYAYKPSDILNLRALMSETALNPTREAQYEVHILMHERNQSNPIYASPKVMQDTIKASTLPKEFHGLVTLWHEGMMRVLYSAIHDDHDPHPIPKLHFQKLSVWGVYRSTFMPVQVWAQQHQEFDHVWHWEMDIRYLGHYGEFFRKLDQFSKGHPGFDAVNRREYIPSLHGSYGEFLERFSPQDPMGVRDFYPLSERPAELDLPRVNRSDITADLITLNPLFRPENSSWILASDSSFPEDYPRRTAIITASRLSRKLLNSMHAHAVSGRSMFSEMLGPSVAYAEGMKIVSAPHPIYFDRAWPRDGIEKVFGGVDGDVWGGYEERWRGGSWFYNADWAGRVFRRWLTGEEGFKEEAMSPEPKPKEDDGKKSEEEKAKEREEERVAKEKKEEEWRRGWMDRLCLPGGWLIHPVK